MFLIQILNTTVQREKMQNHWRVTNITTAVLWKYFRFRTLPGSEAAAQLLQCLAASCPATLWPPVWHHTPTQPAECLIFWVCPVLAPTWDRLTWAVCSEGPACRQPSMHMTSTWTPTERRPALRLYAWRPRSTAQPYLGQHEVNNLQDDGATFHRALKHPGDLKIYEKHPQKKKKKKATLVSVAIQ